MFRKNRWKWIVCMAVCLILFVGNGFLVQADDEDFEIKAEKLGVDEKTYNVQVTVENHGKDWEGYVRVMVDEEYISPSAYDTMISLPEESVKQFVVRIPVFSEESSEGTIQVQLVTEKNKTVTKETFKHLLREEADMLVMGILSDNYSDLTYMDMGGMRLYYYHENMPVRLQEVSRESLTDDLDSLVFLVIDSYNTELFSEEQLDAIESWVMRGGVLLMGTGEYGEEVLKGFENSFLGVSCDRELEPGYGMLQLEHADISKLHTSSLRDDSGMYISYATGAMICNYGDGAIGVMPYSFKELAGMDASVYKNCTQEDFVLYVLEDVSSHSNSRYDNDKNYYYNNLYNMRRMLGLIGRVNSPLNLGVLKVLVVVYVVFAGPVLYIVLRLLKKREWYWAAVPVISLVGILVISFAGRGFEVVDTKAYTVTVQNLAANGERTAYLYCYDAKHEEWSLKLADGYQFAGTMANYSYDSSSDYYHRIIKEGDSLYFGAKPVTNFEDLYFMVGDKGRDTTGMGALTGTGIELEWSGNSIKGTVTNQTEYDLKYIAVIVQGNLYVYEGLQAGESCKLTNTGAIYRGNQNYDVLNDYLYSCVRDAFDDEDAEMTSELAALGIGIGNAYPIIDDTKTIIIGVTDEFENVVDDACNEMSYGCIYQIQ